ncbi:hypothetical protein NS365_03135 [Aureimonas ureilytica]|uniref:Curli assembly protein CsgC n=2 Tax=Aurantimonadaceae TaxID=255475 RepID=A0A175RA01_9HYPH|nr:hypothetical protein NS226_07565 [Aureimonas ureilytica]KTR07587.1 hypothetical protein NS365_03135 [Aureimonas ureilytica]
MRLSAASCLVGCLLMASPLHAQDAPVAIASIAVEGGAGMVRLTGHALGVTAGHVDARMTIEKGGASGRTSTTQGGALDLAAGQDATVASVGLSIGAGDHLTVDLVLMDGEREVSRSRLSVGS